MARRAPEELQACFRSATRFLHGHGRTRARQSLLALAEQTDEQEMPDFYGAGTSIDALEREVAGLLGKPAAVFMPSGTMAQQIALRLWSERAQGAPVAFHPTAHSELHEQHGYRYLHRLDSQLVGERHRLIVRADLEALTWPIAALLLELPQREIGGQLPSWDELMTQAAWASDHGTALHLDGARLWECQPHYGKSLAEIAAPFASVYVSFYKTLGALAGALLLGPEDFIREARVWLRRHGGNLVTVFPYVVSARAALRQRLPRIPAYVARARTLAATLSTVPGVRVIPDPPPTNMMHVALPGEADKLLEASAEVARDTGLCLFTHLRPCGIPGYHVVELAAGDGALAIEDKEVGEAFRRVVEAGALPDEARLGVEGRP